jgi:DNA-binding CsgD family transcriptional regulator
MLSSQLQLERARAAVTALELVGAPAAFVTDRGTLLAANPRFTALLGKEILDVRKGLRFPDANVDALYNQALARLRSDKVGRSIPLPSQEARLRGILHVVPICGEARDIFSSGGAILVIAGASTQGGLSQELLQGLFDLTPAEARLARGLMQGLTLADAAHQFGVAEATIRTQLKALFAKTGQSRQSELVRMLASFISLGGG